MKEQKHYVGNTSPKFLAAMHQMHSQPKMRTAYRIVVRIEIEGEEPPSIEDVEREIADLLRDSDDHNLHVQVLAGLIE